MTAIPRNHSFRGSEPKARAWCNDMLPRVSRTFALCIRLLPKKLEYPVLIGYLLCRIADTIEDTPTISAETREQYLGHFARALDAPAPGAHGLSDLFSDSTGPDQDLARDADVVLGEFHAMDTSVRDAIRPWVQEMCVGMARFTGTDSPATSAGQVAHNLETEQDLDTYCYYVAGTVGRLLTSLFSTFGSDMTTDRKQRLTDLANSFGLGLQLTNIIKDVADDRRRGWSFVPREICERHGITPEQLHDGQHVEAAREVMNALIAKAHSHLSDALDYSTTLARRDYRIRLFCLTSLFFAVRTLAAAKRDPRLLDPAHKVKITRNEVYRTVATTSIVAPSNFLVRAYFRMLDR